MSQVVCRPMYSGDNDDDDQSMHKKKKSQSSCLSIRKYGRIPLKILFAVATVYVCILSSERYFYFWVQTTIERTDMHVSEIDFPAVTIIPMNYTTDNFSLKSDRFSKAYNLYQSVIWKTPQSHHLREEDFAAFPEFKDLDLRKWGVSASWQLNCRFFFSECKWRQKPMNCCDLFRSGKTFSGYAYVFNSILSDDADKTWPWTVAASGAASGLVVKINRQQGQFTLNTLGVIIHEPDQYLGMSIDYSQEDRIVVPVEPLHFTAETDVRARPLQMRRCYFENEIMGRSRSECIYKCHLKYLVEKCRCVLPMAAIAKDTLVSTDENQTETLSNSELTPCGIKDLVCVYNHKFSFFSMSNIIEESRENVFTTKDCGCFPQCEHTQYHTSTYTERLGSVNSYASEIEIDVYFQEETLFSYRSMLRFTLIDLMVSYGGIAGLIMGVSVLGGVNAFLNRFTCCRLPHPD